MTGHSSACATAWQRCSLLMHCQLCCCSCCWRGVHAPPDSIATSSRIPALITAPAAAVATIACLQTKQETLKLCKGAGRCLSILDNKAPLCNKMLTQYP